MGGLSLLVGVALAWSAPASASVCSNVHNGVASINCERAGIAGTLRGNSASAINGYECANRDQRGTEQVVQLICDDTEWVTVDVRNIDCDVDIFVLPDTCDINADPCEAFNEQPGATAFYQTDVLCTPGATFWVVIEGFALGNAPGSCPTGGLFQPRQTTYQLRGICDEDCSDGIDNDWDDASATGDMTDCNDPDCCGDAACPPTAACCDVDGDGAFADDAFCGGDDCDDSDPDVYAGADEEVADGIDQDCDGVDDCFLDFDGDGYGSTTPIQGDDLDCTNLVGETDNDLDCLDLGGEAAAVYPGAPEVTGDGIDQDCDGRDTCYVDVDGDGVGGSTEIRGPDLTCGDDPGYSSSTGDCVDQGAEAAQIFPGAVEICNGFDDDCDDQTDDEDDDRVGGTPYYTDGDGDSWGGAVEVGVACVIPPGFVDGGGDCDDSDPDVNPVGTEMPGDGIDQDCDGGDLCYVDGDGDGVGGDVLQADDDAACGNGDGLSSTTGDCVDEGPLAATIFPEADEVCNGYDDDCDGWIDQGDDSVLGVPTWYFDGDGDTYGDSSTAVVLCEAPFDHVALDGDCDDALQSVNPGASETCNELDDDCNGVADDVTQAGLSAWPDADGDGWGDDALATQLAACELPDGTVSRGGDCDDDDGARNPGATEIPYDGVDQDCDLADLTDVDGDGYPGGPGGLDCVDEVDTIFPGATEYPDGVDQDCDGTVDEGTTAFDDDGDGYAEQGGDCDDGDRTIHPGAPEADDDRDQDCDTLVDEGTFGYDDDGDGQTELAGDCNDGDATVFLGAPSQPGSGIDADCDGVVDGGDGDGDGYGIIGGDCDDADPDVHPFAVEVANGRDDNCNEVIDEQTELYDDDGDGTSESEGDCNDDAPLINPDATEDVDNYIDDNCNGEVDEGGPHVDDDGDGYTEDGGDCDDTEITVRPYGYEQANNRDDDCDGLIDEGVDDADLDGWTASGGDCDDNNGWANPEADEVCDGIDNDCDDAVDEGCIFREDEVVDEPEPDTGGCSSTGGPSGPWWLMLGLLARRRR